MDKMFVARMKFNNAERVAYAQQENAIAHAKAEYRQQTARALAEYNATCRSVTQPKVRT